MFPEARGTLVAGAGLTKISSETSPSQGEKKAGAITSKQPRTPPSCYKCMGQEIFEVGDDGVRGNPCSLCSLSPTAAEAVRATGIDPSISPDTEFFAPGNNHTRAVTSTRVEGEETIGLVRARGAMVPSRAAAVIKVIGNEGFV